MSQGYIKHKKNKIINEKVKLIRSFYINHFFFFTILWIELFCVGKKKVNK